MALKDLLALTDDKLEKVFSERKPDPRKARQAAVRAVDLSDRQFGSTDPVRGRKYWKVNNDVVAFTPPFTIGGKSTLYVPAERFPDFLRRLKPSIEAGDLDADLSKAPAKTGSNKGWSEARKAAFRATMAAKKKK